MSVGISSWTYPWAIGVPHFLPPLFPLTSCDLLERAIALEVGVLQVGDNLPLEKLAPEDFTALKRQADPAGIVLEVSTRGLEPEHLRRFLRVAQALDAKFLRTLTHSEASQPELAQVESWLREVLPEFESAGVSIGLENYERHTARELASLINRMHSSHLGICLDTVNSIGALETPSQVAEILVPWVIDVHVKDFIIERIDTMTGYRIRGCAAGEGCLALDPLMGYIERQGRCPNLILEQWVPSCESLPRTIELEAEWAQRGVRLLKSYAG